MDRVTLLMLGMITIAPCACSASTGAEPAAISREPQLRRWQAFVSEASGRFGIPEGWIYAVMDAESNGETMLEGRPIKSHAGAMGLMQVMPGTWRDMRFEHGLGADPHVPRDNILAGTAYLRAMYDRFGFPGLFAAYNAGPGRYEEHLQKGRPLPKETLSYIKALEEAGISAADMNAFTGESDAPKRRNAPSGSSLFFLRDGVRAGKTDGDLFVPLATDRARPKKRDR
ncbi:lytic transglycosylase domain-containing protein [Allomesorhizobium camelthorni]|uniref:Lytic transglycosylase domain-containing protein n=1 Tax=Allomesorhizobium camelthorni TaxID=475069 RepID=A0A6G4WIU0_9HYPH|nr:lytic transglycosylase domain-containing protein [Mesorhizobium camelthorni]NGO54524.1 lytic transglycosylase domain-containing protein [Mesorhizobium camelthorni]